MGYPYKGALRVWWKIIGYDSYNVPVGTFSEAKKIIEVLADYDNFRVKVGCESDEMCNASGLEVFEDGEWVEWQNEDGDDIDYLMNNE